MQKDKDISKLIDGVLESLDGLQRAEPNPFLYTRVMAGMNREHDSTWEKIANLFSRPVVAFATVILFIAINAVVFFKVSDDSSPAAQEPALMAGNDFGLSVTSFYDINPEQNDVVQK